MKRILLPGFVGALHVASVLGQRELVAAISVTDWHLSTAVQRLSFPSEQDVSSFTVVVNPLVNSHSAALGAGTASTSYDLSWAGGNASFRIDGQHVATDLGSALNRSTSNGDIYFTTTEPLIGRVVAAYTYSLPSFDLYALLGVGITDLRNNQFVLQSGGPAAAPARCSIRGR